VENNGEQDYQSAQDHVKEGRRLAREAFRALKNAGPGNEEEVRSTIEEAINELQQALKDL
jgi:cellobiose-specific phosphotransferase system component IIA